jgi:glycosyltransferase involved in cell wall biosynthesis
VTADVGIRPRRKVLRIIARLNVGGPARHVVILGEGLPSRGYDTLLVHGSIGEGEASLTHSASGHFREMQIQELGRSISPIDDLKAWMKLVRLIFLEKPDVIHTHTAKAGALGRLAAVVFNATRGRKHRSAVIHTFHGHVLSGYFGRVGSSLTRIAERGLAAVSDRIIAISPSQHHDLVMKFKVARPDRTLVIPLGLDLADLLVLTPSAPNLRSELGIPHDAVVLGYVGRFVPIKDLPTLVEGFASAARSHPRLWLVMAGDGPIRPAVESAVRAAGIQDRVRLLGWCEDLPALYSTMDICGLTSLNEGTPVALIEAMAAARPVVASSVGGVDDLVAHGRTGMLVPPQDPVKLAEVIRRLAEDVDERARMGQAARRNVSERFSPSRLVADIASLYDEVLSEKRGSPGDSSA